MLSPIMCLLPALLAAPSIDPSPFGINGLKFEHMRTFPGVWDEADKRSKLLKDAGIYWDRDGIPWNMIEPEQGRFEWTFADKAVESCRKNGINWIVLLSGCSTWSKGAPPRDEAERARFANYVYQVVNRYKSTVRVWEIWNEPNIPSFWSEPNVQHYALLLKEAYRAAKRADPHCIVLAGNTSGPDLGFIRGIREHGAWDYCDGICIHPYSMAGGPVPQRFDKILRIANALIEGTGKTLWITEMGWTAERPDDLENQAIYLFQSYVIALANGVTKLCWFDLEDWAEKWGIVSTIDPPGLKPAYKTYVLMTKYLGSPGACASFGGYLKMPDGVACYVFKRRDGSRILALWTDDGSARAIRLPQAVGLRAVDVLGKPVDVTKGSFEIGRLPVIVTGADARKIGRVSRDFNPYIEGKGDNLLNNPSLNVLHGSDPGWWNRGRFFGTDNKGDFGVSSEGRGGSKCVSISKSTSPAAWDASPIPVEPGKRYRVSAWVRTKGAAGSTQVALFWYSGNMWTWLGEARSENVSGTRDWTEVTASGVPPKDATFVRVNLISEDNTGMAWFDDVRLVEE